MSVTNLEKESGNKRKYILQSYDESGEACKLPRYFEGTKEELDQRLNDMAFNDALCGRVTIAYNMNEYKHADDVPQQIDLLSPITQVVDNNDDGSVRVDLDLDEDFVEELKEIYKAETEEQLGKILSKEFEKWVEEKKNDKI